MPYQALYRAYRPQTFDKVVGQDAVVQTLQNAIINKKITHAYLFCGPRGTGKTSVARIFAKALNCKEQQKNGEPCDNCLSCKEISEGISPDVIEIDAASNNGVDEIRDIRERVKFLPSGAKYKIYIIDEVHMLSTGAFNALLKILEEPPKHVIFILATTEPQKIPATIISRCQRHEFKPISVAEIGENLKQICKNENVEISDEAINLIGEVADGGMRDALSILDQTISYGSKTINIEDVNTITGSINAETMCNLMSYIDSKDTSNALDLLSNMIQEGKEINKIVNGMLLFCRDLMLFKSVGEKKLNKYMFEKEKFKTLALKIPSTKIIYFIEILCDIQNRIKYTNSPAIFLEIAIIRMTSVSNEELDVIKRMDELETKLLDTSFSNDGTATNIDNEKVNNLDARLNKIVSELSKFELPTLTKKVNDIETIVAEKINQDEINASNDNTKSKLLELESEYASKFIEMEAKINGLAMGHGLMTTSNDDTENISNEEIEKFKKDLQNIKAEINGLNKNENSSYQEDLSKLNDSIKIKFEQMQNQLNEIQTNNSSSFETKVERVIEREIDESKLQEIKDELNQRMNEIASSVEVKLENQTSLNDSKEKDDRIDRLNDMIQELSKELYELKAEKLANKEKQTKTLKTAKGQLSMFDFGVEKLEEYGNDFGELNQEETDEENEKTIEITEETKEDKNDLENEPLVETVSSNNENENSEDVEKEDSVEEKQETNETSPVVEENKQVISWDLFTYSAEDNAKKENVQTSFEEASTDDIEFKPEMEDEQEVNNKESASNKLIDQTDDLLNDDILPKTLNEKIKESINVNSQKENTSSIEESKPLNTNNIENKIISEYYDEDKKIQVINKTNSSIVIRKENLEQNEEENSQPDIIVHQEPEGKDKLALYRIADLERILVEAQEPNARNDKNRIIELWKSLKKNSDATLYSIAELLSDGVIEVVGNKELVLGFETVHQCNEAMRWSFKEKAFKLFMKCFGDVYNYVALPFQTWEEKRNEYREAYQRGEKYVKLSPYKIPGLNVNEVVSDIENEKNEKIAKLQEEFGNIVKVK